MHSPLSAKHPDFLKKMISFFNQVHLELSLKKEQICVECTLLMSKMLLNCPYMKSSQVCVCYKM